MTAVHQPPMQRCACGVEFFVVHSCALRNKPVTPKPVVIDITKRDLLFQIEDLERLVRDQQNTITNLMLELADARIEMERLRDRPTETELAPT
jgi:hypothetical protein